MSKEAIIDKIIKDAEIKATAMINEAKDKAEESLAAVTNDCEIYKKQSKKDSEKAVQDLLSRAQTVAELDVKKMLLGAKAQVVDKVFERVLEKLKGLDEKNYLKLLLGMLKYAEDGDVITISKREEKILTKEAVDKYAKDKGIKLSLAKKLGDFDGGMILSSKGVDKNLTFEIEVSLLREEIEMQIAKELFG